MYHAPLNHFKQERLGLWVRPSGGNTGIDVVGGEKLMWFLEKNKNVHVWKSPLLEFDGIDICNSLTKDTMLVNVLNDSFPFHLKHTYYQIRMIIGRLT